MSHADARAVLASVQAGKIAASAPTTTQDLVWNIGPTGKVRVRIVRPADASGDLPAVLYYHGGGWVMGDRNTHDHLIRELAVQASAAVVFVEYDNAPEVRYPVNNEQAYAALKHVAANGAEFGIDGTRLAVAGDSAGGNMAIAVTMMAKERRGPQIRHQLLYYPVTADVSDNASYREFGNGPFLTRKAMDYFLEANYPAEHRQDVLAFPLRASRSQLEGLPAATIVVAENDLLRDEGEAYGRRLIEAGVPVATTRYNGTMHDFVMLNPLAGSEPARAAIAQGAQRLRSALVR
ncbi:alpha/beta hydrolase [Novosphingobium sp. 17-62-19]|uniref:alpha/beta hydrolase n=1 Tax=Novosphingobium sp. 17-62-19 TaxID=1970406 RepID=UPI0025D03268|nr:alpha/beta hydrolase [Novosphingobium sp. 17-62-19]HQS98196.1 alpha/beta hydrolase [Novosphingobium sp.]